jgi:hypothetical protein
MNNPQTSKEPGGQKARGKSADQIHLPPKPPVATPNKTPAQQTKDDVARLENEGGPAIKEAGTA